MKKILIAFVVSAWFLNTTVKAQENQSISEDQVRMFQLGFITPLGTNGLESGRITNHFSINMLAGYAGGLNGLEIGGFSNTLRGEMQGLQLAGFTNINLSGSTGGQISGFSNYTKDSFKGFQLAGFTNVVTNSVTGFQGAGFCNIVTGKITGSQISGFLNYAESNDHSIQIAGFTNIAKGNASNVQVAGFSNVITGDLEGAQISGFFNIARKVRGIQLGFLNIADTIEKGIPIGFLSIVRKGYHTIEVSGDETFYGQVSVKTGTEKLYNIFSAGAKQAHGDFYWGIGYGIGTLKEINPRLQMNLDLMTYHVNQDSWVNEQFSMLHKLKLNASWNLNKNIKVFGGPSYNVLESWADDDDESFSAMKLAPYTTYEKTKNHHRIQMYPGFTLGFRFF